MNHIKIILLLVAFILGACSPKTVVIDQETSGEKENLDAATTDVIDQTEIIWDEWGVPHIYAANNEELFYSFGWAQMKSHTNTILSIYGFSRGRAAEYWGEENVPNDMMVHTLDLIRTANSWYHSQDDEFRGYIDAFADGMNAYAESHPEAIEEENKVVLPIENKDILRHALFVIYTRFVGGGDLQQVNEWDKIGSNTYAVGPERSASGKAMLVMNPHLPWFGEWLFYEGHFNAPGINIYGATLVGLPTLGIAFNENLGWSHTNNTIDNADRYELTLKEGGYVVDGEVRPFSFREASLKIKKEDGTFEDRQIQLLSTPEHGSVLKMGKNKALTIKMPGFDRPYGIVQWWRMGTSNSFKEFQSSLKEVQIPFFNIMYADKEGNIFYMFNGQVPVRKTGDWDYWSGIVDGSFSDNLWEDVHTFDDLPKILNPPTGWLQNANDPPWTSTLPIKISPNDYPKYMAPVFMGFRPQRSARMLVEDESITFDELVNYKLSTRIEMADRLLADLFEAIEKYGSIKAYEAREVLRTWDKEANADSRGMALFYNWAHSIGPYNNTNYKNKWTIADPQRTPNGLADPKGAVKALEDVVAKFEKANLPLDIAWGDIYRIKYNGKDLPGNGSDGSVGIFRVAWSEGPEEDGKSYISGGDSWQGIIEFGDRVKAKVLLSYGNSTQTDSPHYGDQLELFSKKELRDCYFYRSDVEKHMKERETLTERGFK